MTPDPGPECTPCPVYLVGYGSDEWSRVAPVLWSMGLLSPLDSAALSAYCWSFKTWRESIELAEASPRHRPALLQIARRFCLDPIAPPSIWRV